MMGSEDAMNRSDYLVFTAAALVVWSAASCGGSVDASGETESTGTGGAAAQAGSGGSPSKGGSAGEADASAGQAGSPGQGGSSGCSSDLDNDPLNCGACGTACLGGECKAGKCQPEAGIDPSSKSWWRLQADEQNIYLAETVVTEGAGTTTLWRKPKQGGKLAKLGEFPRAATGIGLGSDAVILTLVGTGEPLPNAQVTAVPKSGGQTTELATEELEAWSPVVYGEELYWLGTTMQEWGASTFIRSVSISGGGAAKTLVQFPSQIVSLEVDETNLYFAAWMVDHDGKGSDSSLVYHLPKDGSAEPKWIAGQGDSQILGPVLLESKLYWLVGPWHETSPQHWRGEWSTLDGMNLAMLSEFDPTKSPRYMVVDSSYIYFTRASEGSEERELTRIPSGFQNTGLEVIDAGLGVTTLAQDDTAVYFVNKANALVRLAK